MRVPRPLERLRGQIIVGASFEVQRRFCLRELPCFICVRNTPKESIDGFPGESVTSLLPRIPQGRHLDDPGDGHGQARGARRLVTSVCGPYLIYLINEALLQRQVRLGRPRFEGRLTST